MMSPSRPARIGRQLTPRRLLVAVLALVFAVALSACGKSHQHQKFGDTEGTYLSVGALNYQVQISRQLNPADLEDQAYLAGLSPSEKKLTPDQAWFAVFVRVENTSHQSQPAANLSDYTITDTQDTVYTPTLIDTSLNPFAYKPQDVPANGAPHGGILPPLESMAATSPTNASLLLFKVKIASYDNRPLVLKIQNPTDSTDSARVDLDV